ncbi:MBL fold metallo-hydrolase [Ideonella sp. 4Y16]|uniref:MBL fold metallo-hydrolase n=1 Tax=Ideonella alba TaxID=2824118 RepID=A0A941BGV0_9BURK|nr:MBL fold metallo-hydrolase [Ideonella alba]MBQ0933376.1 MBL fold metallo-hydrolase [Ideonella alba]MBQ0943977.1 MBL fold metallo-hydrolase [Ideonella alba]
MTLPTWLVPLGGGVHLIDTAFQRDHFDAAYLVVDQGRAAFVDTGTGHALPRLLGALEALGLARDAVDWVIPTHVHLDHAGGVGPLMQHLPRARVLVHPRGARHLIDPSALYQGALAVYGQAEMDRSYGQLVGVPAERVDSSHDGQQVALGGRQLALIDTPGHARHHHAIWDPVTRGWFTGDTFGLSYREFDVDGRAWILPTSTPVQFEPEALVASIQRLRARQPDCVYLTHYGRLGQVQALADSLLEQLAQMVALAEAVSPGPTRHAQLREGLLQLYLDALARHGCPMARAAVAEALAIDIELNAQGMGIWLDRRAASPSN